MKHRMTVRLSGLVLSSAMIMQMFAGCGPAPPKREEESVSGVLSAENTRVGTEKLALDFGEDFPPEDGTRVEIRSGAPEELEGARMDVYEFTMDGDGGFLPVMELTMPYDEEALGGRDPEGNVGAAYFNEETREWEPVPFRINGNGTVTVRTDHLSRYGCLVIDGDYTGTACIQYVMTADAMRKYNYSVRPGEVVLETIGNGGDPGKLSLAVGIEFFQNVLSEFGNSISVGTAGVETLMISPEYAMFTRVYNGLGLLGTLLSVGSLVTDVCGYLESGERADAYAICHDAFLLDHAYIMGKVGSNLANLASLGVMAVDYSLSRFGEAAFEGRKDLYRKAYALYYEEENRRSVRDWVRMLEERRTDRAGNPVPADEFREEVRRLVEEYAGEFWEDEVTVALYQGEVGGHAWTGGGGLTEEVKREISREYADALCAGVIQDAFRIIGRRDVQKARRNLLNGFRVALRDLNRTCVLKLYDGGLEGKKTSGLAGARVSVELPPKITDPEKWSVVLDDRGKGEIRFTMLAYLMAGMPSKLRVREKDAERPGAGTGEIPFSAKDFSEAGGGFEQEVDIGRTDTPDLLWKLTDVRTHEYDEYVDDWLDGTVRKRGTNSVDTDDSGCSFRWDVYQKGDPDAHILVTVSGVPREIRLDEEFSMTFSVDFLNLHKLGLQAHWSLADDIGIRNYFIQDDGSRSGRFERHGWIGREGEEWEDIDGNEGTLSWDVRAAVTAKDIEYRVPESFELHILAEAGRVTYVYSLQEPET